MQYYCLAFIPAPEGGYAIFSPDFPELASQGEDIADCIEMAMDALRIIASEYAREKKALPVPSSFVEAKGKIAAELKGLGMDVPQENILYQFIPAPSVDMNCIEIPVTFTRRTLDIIDSKARARGMTRSDFLAAAAHAYA